MYVDEDKHASVAAESDVAVPKRRQKESGRAGFPFRWISRLRAYLDAVRVRHPLAPPRSRQAKALRTQFAQAGRQLQQGRDLQTTERLTRDTWSFFGRLTEDLKRRGFRSACVEQCCFCCATDVTASAPEIISLAAYVRSSLSVEARLALRERIGAYLERDNDPRKDSSRGKRRWCPLLVRGSCCAYEHRPLACRGWTSVDRLACERDFNAGIRGLREHVVRRFVSGEASPRRQTGSSLSHGALRAFFRPIDADLWMASEILEAGLGQALRAVGVHDQGLQLAGALRIALDAPSLEELNERWRNGERVFAEAERPRTA